MDVEINSDTVNEVLLDEIKELHRRLAYQAAAIKLLQLENTAFKAMMRQPLPPPPVLSA